MDDQSSSYPSQPQPPPPAAPQPPPQSPTSSEQPPPPPPPAIPPNSQYPLPPGQNYNPNNPMPYPNNDPNQMRGYNHNQGRPSYGQSYQTQNSYQQQQNNNQHQQQGQGQYVPGAGRGEANKNKNHQQQPPQQQGQQLWHRMKRKCVRVLSCVRVSQACFFLSAYLCLFPITWCYCLCFNAFFVFHRGTWSRCDEVQHSQATLRHDQSEFPSWGTTHRIGCYSFLPSCCSFCTWRCPDTVRRQLLMTPIYLSVLSLIPTGEE